MPEHLTDERTEVGQVGAALNTLLAHVETSLDARHRSEQQVRQFVADASHELRTPAGDDRRLHRAGPQAPERRGGDRRPRCDKVEEESGRMTSLVEDLLLLARLDSGRPLEREPVDLTRLLLEAVSDARVVAPDHHWRLDVPDDAVDTPYEVTGDELRLHQVVTNLLTNAAAAHAGRYDGHGARCAGTGSRCTTTARASRRSWSSTPSSGSPAATPPAPAAARSASASGSPWSRRSSPPTAAPSRCSSVPGDTTLDVRLTE